MANILKWLENLWNLRLIFDKYLPQIRAILETIRILQEQIDDLRQAKIDLEKELKKLLEEQRGIPIDDDQTVESCKKPTIIVPEGLECVGEPEYSKYLDRDYYKPKHEVTKVDKYYDPQLGVEYTTIEVNGDKVSPDEDTVKE